MKMAPWIGFTVALIAAGCSKELNPDSGDDGPGTGVVDGTEDVDDDTRGDDDTDVIDDFLDCRVDYPTVNTGEGDDECLTEQLFCGDVIQGTTVGGSDVFGYPEYEDMGCISISSDWSGSERVYRFRLPAYTEGSLRVHTKCGEFRMRLLNEDSCDAPRLTTTSCTVATQEVENNVFGTFIPSSNQAKTFFVIVDGAEGYEGNYALEVVCEEE